jgi:SPX domain protein involved in polyphosphate accumulation
MKFGKRLISEAARRWGAEYLDYKAVKRALKSDLSAGGEFCSAPAAAAFTRSSSPLITDI